ncbi:phosphoadenylyl-sulfate reductase [Sediminicurvatus halobius]|uniref:Phosphoadenosine 5'-phosphosulfate reductase n=1 Tax=Sediminicurvatus halobius TaxID=2182432 RepID=A0A2U2N5V3_9GAMM|nr:phosphoadenylyl-sulfate reductase [Spiribacter halobius]PWG64536.1 phosphoadenosine phosphosulfate reductase [Spiribacter halobius]UEX79140.1 phosphoadenylyl-sulfate reductase [Spiribacter halobius]
MTVISWQTGLSGEVLARANARLEARSAEERVAWALERFGDRIVLASSFGIQAALMLHLVSRQRPDIPVVLVDTGYLFAETYRFADALTERLGLNLQVYRPALSAAWQEARDGRLWERGLEGIERYNRLRKVEPMQRALRELRAQAWFSGLRRAQSATRERLGVLAEQGGRIKVHPVVDWSDRDVHRYLQAHDLPYHPLREQGYVSVGDWHTTRRLADGMRPEDTRFFGLKRECGLHEAG